MTTVNYNLVVQELSKGLRKRSDPVVEQSFMYEHAILREYRTISFGGARQTGKTQWIVDQIVNDPKRTLVIMHDRVLLSNFHKRVRAQIGDDTPQCMTLICGNVPVFPPNTKFDAVYIDDAGQYFNTCRIQKTFRSLAGHCTEDAVVYLIY